MSGVSGSASDSSSGSASTNENNETNIHFLTYYININSRNSYC